jgi:hypothetical protein
VQLRVNHLWAITKMKGILALRLRKDTTVEQDFSVYSHL